MTPCRDCGTTETFIGIPPVVNGKCDFYLCKKCYDEHNKQRKEKWNEAISN